jgi:hypothetical protein
MRRQARETVRLMVSLAFREIENMGYSFQGWGE